jgi:putative membrane protein
MEIRLPKILLLFYLLVFAICAIEPYDRAVWWAENIPVMLLVTLLVISYRYFQFSNTSYILMSVFLILHTIGGHYTFERVPFDFVSGLFGFERNHYDRLAHFSVGFYAYPIAELLLRLGLVRSRLVLYLFAVFAIVTIAGAYEVFEWWYAVSADEAAGIAVLGSQGDIWDAQKDMLADTLGALSVMTLFMKLYKEQLKTITIRQ